MLEGLGILKNRSQKSHRRTHRRQPPPTQFYRGKVTWGAVSGIKADVSDGRLLACHQDTLLAEHEFRRRPQWRGEDV